MARTSNSASARPVRTPIGTRHILSVRGKDPNFHYRIVNDEGGRIQEFLDAGYELVDAADVQIGDKRVNNPTPEGTKAQITVGRKGEKAFLMRIKKEWFDEDQAEKLAKSEELMRTIKQQASTSADYGSLEIKRD